MAKEFMGWSEVEESYIEVLDSEGTVTVGSLEFYPSDILERMDPIAYREGLNDYADMLSEDYAVEGVNDEEAEQEEQEDEDNE